MTKIKICGMTNTEDAEKAVSLGADAVGFIFADSPRKITPREARAITKGLEGKALRVGVFVNELSDEVNRISDYCGLDAVQLHGDENPGYCSGLKMPVIKAFRIKNESDLAAMPAYKNIFAYLLDTFSEKQYGGTGKPFDWDIAVKAKAFGKPIILSGGLGAANIARAIKVVTPYGVDISSSVEAEPGKKDHGLMSEVISLIKALD